MKGINLEERNSGRIDLPLVKTAKGNYEFYLSLKEYKNVRYEEKDPDKPYVRIDGKALYLDRNSIELYKQQVRNTPGESFSLKVESRARDYQGVLLNPEPSNKEKALYDYLRLRVNAVQEEYFAYVNPNGDIDGYERQFLVLKGWWKKRKRNNLFKAFKDRMEEVINEQEQLIPEEVLRLEDVIRQISRRVDEVKSL